MMLITKKKYIYIYIHVIHVKTLKKIEKIGVFLLPATKIDPINVFQF